VGGGRIARILSGGWAKAGKLPGEIVVSDPDSKSLRRLTEQFPALRAAGELPPNP
jgi:pyrroline-5-carboxylate reductase